MCPHRSLAKKLVESLAAVLVDKKDERMAGMVEMKVEKKVVLVEMWAPMKENTMAWHLALVSV